MSTLLAPLLALPAGLAVALIAVLVFAEAAVFVGFVLPGETAVLIGGVLASTGRISLPLLLVVVVVAAVAGDSVGYKVGRRFGPRLLGWRLLRPHQHRIGEARDFLRRRGGCAVLLGRFTAFLRAVTPVAPAWAAGQALADGFWSSYGNSGLTAAELGRPLREFDITSRNLRMTTAPTPSAKPPKEFES